MPIYNMIYGGTEVQRKTGTFTTVNGEATVICGFQPDIVVIYESKTEPGYFPTCGFAFAEDKRNQMLSSILPTYSGDTKIYDFWVTSLSNGFYAAAAAYDTNWVPSQPNKTFQFIAVKYTE